MKEFNETSRVLEQKKLRKDNESKRRGRAGRFRRLSRSLALLLKWGWSEKRICGLRCFEHVAGFLEVFSWILKLLRGPQAFLVGLEPRFELYFKKITFFLEFFLGKRELFLEILSFSCSHWTFNQNIWVFWKNFFPEFFLESSSFFSESFLKAVLTSTPSQSKIFSRPAKNSHSITCQSRLKYRFDYLAAPANHLSVHKLVESSPTSFSACCFS